MAGPAQLCGAAREPVVSDVNKGGNGDCGILASLVSLDLSDLSLLQGAMALRFNGMFSVHMQDPNGKPITMNADRTF